MLLSLFLLAASRAAANQLHPLANDDTVTIWGDASIDFLYCTADECGDQVKVCMSDQGCRGLLHCAKECRLDAFGCLLKQCRVPILEATRSKTHSLVKFKNLTACIGGNCPRDEDSAAKAAEQEEAEDAACIEAVRPIVVELNETTVNVDNCNATLTSFTDKIREARQICQQELDVEWALDREFLLHNRDPHKCIARFNKMHLRLQQVIDVLSQDEEEQKEEEELARHEKQGETDKCVNIEFGDEGEPWVDSDGDSCAVYTRYICIKGRQINQNHIEHACLSRDCRGSGGMYASQACCACGGGNARGTKRPSEIVENIKALYSQRCMLSKCIELLGQCQLTDNCIDGLQYISNRTCPIGESIQRCLRNVTTTKNLNERASAALLAVMDCAGRKNTVCENNLVPTEPNSGRSGGSSDGGSSGSGGKPGKPVGLIVTMTLIGAVMIGGGVFGAYTWYKQRSAEHTFRRVQISDDDDGTQSMMEAPEL